MKKEVMSIREIVKSMNLTTRTLRYYEEIGLITSIQEGRGNRLYSKEEVSKIVYLNELKNRGFSLKEIEGLLGNLCCHKKGEFLESRVRENQEMIEFLTWQNKKIEEEKEIIKKLGMINTYFEIQEMEEKKCISIDEVNSIDVDPDVEKVWMAENYDERQEKIYVGNLEEILENDEKIYRRLIYPSKKGDTLLEKGKYLVVYSREGLKRQNQIFKQMKIYAQKNNLDLYQEVFVENKFRIFCTREKKTIIITKNYIRVR